MKKKIILIMIVTVVLTCIVFIIENFAGDSNLVVTRNAYGEGKKVENYELVIEDGEVQEIQLEVQERTYSHAEIQMVFQEVVERLDDIVLGENESFDRVERNLNLATELDNYPVNIQWQLDSYHVLNLYGEIQEKNLVKEGTLVELRATISYGEEAITYVRNARVYPLTRTGIDRTLHEVMQTLQETEEGTRTDESFSLPEEIDGQKLQWIQKKDSHWYFILVIGIVICILLIYRERDQVKQLEKKRNDELTRAYPGMISKFTMLLSTGTTVKNAWEKIVKSPMESKVLYEEMLATYNEIQGGVPETEAYERFGKRCKITAYMKFGTLLSQNLRKGSKGISDTLRMEAIQSFENRKSSAKRVGEEAGTKLLMPMLGMLAVVLIMVMVPALLTMQL